MKHILKKKLPLGLEKKSLAELTREMKKIDASEDLFPFFKRYFTDSERDMIVRRAAVGILLKDKVSYRKIRDSLEISQGTISRTRDLLDGRGYGRNPNRKRKYGSSYSILKKKRKEKKLFRPYKGAQSII